MRTWHYALAALALLAGLAVYVLTGAPVKPDAPDATLIVSQGTDAQKLDPQDVSDGDSVRVCVNLYDTLVRFRRGNTFEVEPALALRWEHSPDGYAHTFRLRPGVTFHDGTPCDGAAVIFSLERIARGAAGPHAYGGLFEYQEFYRGIASVHLLDTPEGPDPMAIVIELEREQDGRPVPPMAAHLLLTNLAMFPASIVSPAAVTKHEGRFAEQPVGTGPFVFRQWQRDERIVLERNPAYWDGAPELARLIFQPKKSNATRLAALRAGEIHWMSGVNPADMDAIRADPDLVLATQPGANTAYLALLCTEGSPFADRQVRRAVARVIDKRKIAELYYGIGEVAGSLVPPMVFGHALAGEGWRVPGFDPAAAKAELAQSARYAGGFATTLHYMTEERPYMPQPEKVALVIQHDLAALGITAELRPSPWNTYKVEIHKGQYPLALIGWITDNGDPDNFLQLLGPEERDGVLGPAHMNDAKWLHPEFNDLLGEARAAPVHAADDRGATRAGADRAARAAQYARMQRIAFAEEHPLVPLVHVQQVVAYRRTVRGFELHPTGNAEFRHVTRADR